MHIGIDSFIQMGSNLTQQQRTQNWLEEVKLADRVGIHTYGVGEHHREEYLASSPTTYLAAAAAITQSIRLSSAVTVLSSDDPVRVFQQFATIDLVSNGRAEVIVGRGSFIESYPLFGYDTQLYDQLFAEKLDLLLELQSETHIHWQGKLRPSLTGQGVWPRPVQAKMPIRLGVGGTPASFARAGALGLPLTVAIIGGEPHRFRPLVDLYREAWAKAGHDPAKADVAVHVLGFLADTDQEAADIYWPMYNETYSRLGRERGWGPISRRAYDATIEPGGAFLIGSPASVEAKARYYNDVLGGLSQIGLHMSGGGVPHNKQLRSIELLGKVAQGVSTL